VDLTRTTDGLRRCTLCFDLVAPGLLFVDLDGRVWDVCRSCASEADGCSERPAPAVTPHAPRPTR
jgi:hypothetical protein